MKGIVSSVSINPRHGISKIRCEAIQLITDLGVDGDAHKGKLVQHRWLKKKNPTLPNRAQVHLLHEELFAELLKAGFAIGPAEMGENITTRGIDLLRLPTGARLKLGESAMIEITGLREPCSQLNRLQPGLMKELRIRQPDGKIVRRAGVMGVVLAGGEVRRDDEIVVSLPALPWVDMGPV